MITSRNLPIGISDFNHLFKRKCWLADKSAFIEEFMKTGTQITLITRPRRWGKTLLMSMVYYFLAYPEISQAAPDLFKELFINQVDNGEFIKQHQGQYPVIFISLKDTKSTSFSDTLDGIKSLMQTTCRKYAFLADSEKLTAYDREQFLMLINGSISEKKLEDSLKTLTELLYKHYNKKVIVLIDEYDAPLNASYGKFYDELVVFMRNFLSAVFKDNEYLEQGLLTGVMRISQSSIFSGLNNLRVFTVFNKNYREYFGFSEVEVKQLLADISPNEIKLKDLSEWYNGYRIDGLVLYNPWSVLMCLAEQQLKPYWVNTADDSLLADLVINAEESTKEKFAQLLQNKTIHAAVSEHVIFAHLKQDEKSLWSLLVCSGYLQPETIKISDNYVDYDCLLRVPNFEVRVLYLGIFKNWLEQKPRFRYQEFLSHLLKANVNKFTEELGRYLLASVSLRDATAKSSEAFYHGFVLALVISLKDRFDITSNREGGHGFYDVMVVPKTGHGEQGIILEFKAAKSSQNITEMAEQALQQINAKNYAAELSKQSHIRSVLKIGLAFGNKSVRAAYLIHPLKERVKEKAQLSNEIYADDDDIF